MIFKKSHYTRAQARAWLRARILVPIHESRSLVEYKFRMLDPHQYIHKKLVQTTDPGIAVQLVW